LVRQAAGESAGPVPTRARAGGGGAVSDTGGGGDRVFAGAESARGDARQRLVAAPTSPRAEPARGAQVSREEEGKRRQHAQRNLSTFCAPPPVSH